MLSVSTQGAKWTRQTFVSFPEQFGNSKEVTFYTFEILYIWNSIHSKCLTFVLHMSPSPSSLEILKKERGQFWIYVIHLKCYSLRILQKENEDFWNHEGWAKVRILFWIHDRQTNLTKCWDSTTKLDKWYFCHILCGKIEIC